MALTVESISKLSNVKKLLILAGILLVLGGVYVKVFILPEQEEFEDRQVQYRKLVKELNESKAITQDLKTYKDQVKRMNEEFSAALLQLPNEKEIPEILTKISGLGKEAQLEFVLFRPKPEEPQQFYARVPIELTMVGTYHHIGLFFDKVSKLSRIINVVDFNMIRAKESARGGKEGGEEVAIRTSCMMNTYRFVEKKVEEKKSEKKAEKKPAEEDANVDKTKK